MSRRPAPARVAWPAPRVLSGWSNLAIADKCISRCASFQRLSPCRTKNTRFARFGKLGGDLATPRVPRGYRSRAPAGAYPASRSMSGPNDESVSNESVSRSESGGGGASASSSRAGTKKRTETYAIRASSSFPKSARCNGTRTLSPRAARSEHNACSKETAPRATHFVAQAALVFFPNACDVNVSSAPYASTNSASPGAARTRKSRRRAKTCAPREDLGVVAARRRFFTVCVCVCTYPVFFDTVIV